MYGEAEYMDIKVYILTDFLEVVSYIDGNHGDEWHFEEIFLLNDGKIKIYIEGVVGENEFSDVAIDDIYIYPGYCKGPILPTKPPTAGTTVTSTFLPSTSSTTSTITTTTLSTVTSTSPPSTISSTSTSTLSSTASSTVTLTERPTVTTTSQSSSGTTSTTTVTSTSPSSQGTSSTISHSTSSSTSRPTITGTISSTLRTTSDLITSDSTRRTVTSEKPTVTSTGPSTISTISTIPTTVTKTPITTPESKTSIITAAPIISSPATSITSEKTTPHSTTLPSLSSASSVSTSDITTRTTTSTLGTSHTSPSGTPGSTPGKTTATSQSAETSGSTTQRLTHTSLSTSTSTSRPTTSGPSTISTISQIPTTVTKTPITTPESETSTITGAPIISSPVTSITSEKTTPHSTALPSISSTSSVSTSDITTRTTTSTLATSHTSPSGTPGSTPGKTTATSQTAETSGSTTQRLTHTSLSTSTSTSRPTTSGPSTISTISQIPTTVTKTPITTPESETSTITGAPIISSHVTSITSEKTTPHSTALPSISSTSSVSTNDITTRTTTSTLGTSHTSPSGTPGSTSGKTTATSQTAETSGSTTPKLTHTSLSTSTSTSRPTTSGPSTISTISQIPTTATKTPITTPESEISTITGAPIISSPVTSIASEKTTTHSTALPSISSTSSVSTNDITTRTTTSTLGTSRSSPSGTPGSTSGKTAATSQTADTSGSTTQTITRTSLSTSTSTSRPTASETISTSRTTSHSITSEGTKTTLTSDKPTVTSTGPSTISTISPIPTTVTKTPITTPESETSIITGAPIISSPVTSITSEKTTMHSTTLPSISSPSSVSSSDITTRTTTTTLGTSHSSPTGTPGSTSVKPTTTSQAAETSDSSTQIITHTSISTSTSTPEPKPSSASVTKTAQTSGSTLESTANTATGFTSKTSPIIPGTSSGPTTTITSSAVTSSQSTTSSAVPSGSTASDKTSHTPSETSGITATSTSAPGHTLSSTTLTSPTGTRPTTAHLSTITSTISPTGPGSCVVEGDPHYHTFDKQLHHFMGTCTYTLSKLCEDDGHLPPFNVEAANNHRGSNTKVSYVQYVNVDVHGYRITLDQGREVRVNGKVVVLPVDLQPDIEIFISGNNVLLTTGFGLQVKFDGNRKVVVTIPGIYSNKVCGMCGNFNGNKADDFLNPEGVLEPNSTSLGNSWQVDNDTRCSPGEDHTPSCTDDDKNIISSNGFCGLITDSNGPFKECHTVIDPFVYFDSCVYDLCEMNMDPEFLCHSLESYADACQSHGIVIHPWRNETFCPLQCPANSHYEQCGTACPATCVNPSSPSSCNLPCTEGCVCDEGYVLYDKKCVPSDQCGCWDGDKYYPVGSEFWSDDTCSSKCICPSEGRGLNCTEASCPSNQYCGINSGVPGCYPFVFGICRVHNDPHYDTFDRQNHNFMGLCTYTLAKLCGNSSSLPYFNVEAKNVHRGDPSVSFVEKVLIEVYGQKVQMVTNEQDRVLVNGIWTTLPVSLVEGSVTVTWTGKYVTLQTDFRLTVSFDTDSSVDVKIPSTYSGLTCGICGNFNNRKSDDFLMPNGERAPNAEVLGHSWMVDDDDPLCHPSDPEPDPLPDCPLDEQELYESNAFCGLLISRDGPFHVCNSVISPAGFFESCLFDMCALNGDQDILCSLLGAYADACQKEGILINWRTSTLCPPECPSNSHYNTCMSSCPATCLKPEGPENCDSPCLEGCQCDEGYVTSGATCVSKDNCGCWYNETYYKAGEKFMQGNCEYSCECLGNNTVECSSLSCSSDEICKVQNGTLGCYPPSSAFCHVFGDPHYKTFDGTLHHFQGSCTYTVAKTCVNTLNNFIVTTRNEHRGNPTWTAINSVALTVEGTHIILQKNNIILVNDVSVTLPVYLARINITQSGRYAFVTTDFGLELQFNGDHELFVRVKENYKETLCGLCGTYNNDRRDDFTTSDGTVVSDVNDFGNSWRVEDDDWPCNSTITPPSTCDPSLLEQAESRCWIIKHPDGPFSACHAHLSSHLYFESCVYDHCATGGSLEYVCYVLESYAAACEALGVSLGNWVQNTICDPNATTTAIPSTTPPGSTTTHSTASPPISTTTPLTRPSTGPITLSSTVSPTPGSSSSTAKTTIATTTDPTPRPPGSCVVHGDPHYLTFDNQLHHFMGTCTYTLSKVCEDDGILPSFNVEAANEHRGSNTRVSYVKYVNVDVHGYRITLYKNREVTVNGISIVLPRDLEPDIKIFISGNNVLVTTEFGLQVSFDGNHKVVVTIPGTYSSKVCGLCGNFNGNKNDDFLNPEGELESDSNSLGNSWQVENDTRCSPGEDNTPECSDDDKNIISSNSFCGLITNINGPFKECHSVIDPLLYFDACVYDMCALNMDREYLCHSLQSYAEVCQSHGVTIEPWRNETFCPLQCPANSHYEQCGTACPATCVNQSSPSNCNLPCTEGCVCDEGYVLYDKKCVPSDQCGCWDGDTYYPVGSEFWSDDTCSSKCICPSEGSGIICTEASCPINQYCGINNRVPGCYPFVFGICRVHNDPHYDTFDRQNHNFMGLCTYTLAKLCGNSSSLPYFNVEAKNVHRGDPSVSFVEKVLIEVYGQKVQMVTNEQDRVLVNGIWTTLPVSLVEGSVTVTWTGKYVTLETDFRLTVSFDTDSSVDVKIPSTYSGLTCGICGNFNNRKSDDFLMPNGERAPNTEVLGHSWMVDDDDPLCHPSDPEPDPLPDCPLDEQELYESNAFCGLLISRDGPFHVCNSVISPAGFFESCLFDMCALNGDQDILCSLLGAYADACQKEGILINWRTTTLCPPKCPSNSHYNTCMSSCPGTCLDPDGPEICDSPCLEGCQCDEGYVISGGTCVSKDNCGCWYSETYYKEGEKFMQGNCESNCECRGNNTVECSPLSCSSDEICKVQNGALGCYPPSTAVCHIYGDPHYTTFDGTLHHFQGSCTYTVTETCVNTSNNFIVTTRNEHRGNPTWTAINSVALTVEGTHIVLQKNNIVVVNDVSVTLPVYLARINITQSGRYAFVTTDFGLELQFNGDHELFVRVKENYKETLCGLCGTYNNDRRDDFTTSDGTVVSDVNDFGNSWRVEDDDWPCNSTTTPPSTCDPSLLEQAESRCWIIKHPDGPFSACHAHLSSHLYFESCVYDHCATGGSLEYVCYVLESYAAACEALGVSLGNWVQNTICDPNATTTAIPSTTPPVSSTTTSSSTTSSGTTTSSTTATTSLTATTVRPSTSTHTTTTRAESTRVSTAAPPPDLGICIASGDPHYNTFDNKVHHYMGNCSYTLSKLCDGSPIDLPYFHVYTTNEHRSSYTKVSYVQSVHVEVFNNKFDLLKTKKLNVNGIRRNVPITGDGYRIYISGAYLIVETEFGLRVKFDGNHYVDVYVPPIYKEHLCGLCGNYNGNPTDDFYKPDGSIAADSNELGNSWIVTENTASCAGEDPGTCDSDLEAVYSQNTYCGILTDLEGLFKDCHTLINPDNFYESCLQDMCFTGGESISLCYAVQAYAQQCSEAGVCVEWRSDTFCPISCPGRSQYRSCGSGCPTTCYNSQSPTLCNSQSLEGCFCDEGYVLSGDRCVPEIDCGCLDGQDHFYELGESWFTHENCTERCTCNRNNFISCTPWNCGDLQTCENKDGVIGCHSSGKAACHVSGDPHIYTFDKVMHDFMGTCTYILVTTCNNNSVIPLTISGKTEDRGQRAATYLREVYIDVYDIRLTLQKGKRTLVENELVNSPWAGHVKGLTIGTVGLYVVVETDFGVIIKFDGNHHLEIILPDAYFSKVCGICGNFNNDMTDELLMPNGVLAADVVMFGNSWKSEADSDSKCLDDDRNDLNPPCTADQGPAIEAQCNILLSDTFRACHHIIDPELFTKSCVYDMCMYDGMVSTLCAIFEAYVDACRSEGINIKWRNSTLCSLPCPTNSHYSDCASLCPATCNDIYASAVCDKPNKCVEGCVCNDGYVLSEGKCVQLRACGCRDSNDNYYNVDSTWITPQCTQKCQCYPGNAIRCKEFSCPHSVCTLKTGKYYCQPSAYAKCTIAGDPHYGTFDGLSHHFQGKETYVLTRTSSSLPDYMEPYTIQGKNVPMARLSPYSLLKEVRIEVYNQVIVFTEKRDLVINGVKTVPPAQPHEGIKIYQKPTRIYLETDFGLSVNFDGTENGEIVVPSNYRDVLEGLCGNYDSRRLNDFMRPDGSTVISVNVFGESWNVKGLSRRTRREAGVSKLEEDEEVLETGDNLACSSSQLAIVNSTDFCGVINNANGPFRNCLPVVPADDFVLNCLFDTCAEFRSFELLCSNLEQYSLACQQNNADVDGWRAAIGCEKVCTDNSQYKDRMTSCPASCSDLASESECEDPDVEGCACDSGHVLSGLDCVSYKDCGCTYLGSYYVVGQAFFTSDCSQKCACSQGQNINCEANMCAEGEVCTTANQTLGCYIPGPCLDNPCLNGGICIEESNTTMHCDCPRTFSGEICEIEGDDYDQSVIYIVIGVVVGVFAISILAVLSACLYYRSRRKKKLTFDSSYVSEGGSESYSSISDNQATSSKHFTVNYEELGNVDDRDGNVYTTTVGDTGDLVELVVMDSNISENKVSEKLGAAAASKDQGGVTNPAFEPDSSESKVEGENTYINILTGESKNDKEEMNGVTNPAFEPDTTDSKNGEEKKHIEEDVIAKADKETIVKSDEDPNLEKSGKTIDEKPSFDKTDSTVTTRTTLEDKTVSDADKTQVAESINVEAGSKDSSNIDNTEQTNEKPKDNKDETTAAKQEEISTKEESKEQNVVKATEDPNTESTAL
uniref:Uncharacterized protein n=1 Tax=Leptobrachium leishanense TaxID=445787 RepID=A0A8C5QJV0_9ANUR